MVKLIIRGILVVFVLAALSLAVPAAPVYAASPVINNLFGDSVDVIAGGSAGFIDENGDATVTDADSPNFNTGFLDISQTAGTANGNLSVDGANVTSGGDAVIAAGETIVVGGVAVGTVNAVFDGQGGNDLHIGVLNANATPARVTTLIRNIKYAAPTGLGARDFLLMIDDGSGGFDLAIFTVNVLTAPPVINNLDGDSLIYDACAGGASLLDDGTDATVTDADSADFSGGSVTVTITAGKDASEDKLGIYTGGTVATACTGAGCDVSVGGTVIGTLGNTIFQGNDLVVNFNADATPARVTTLLRALTYENVDGINPTYAPRSISITVNDGDGGTSAASVVTVTNLPAPEMHITWGGTPINDGSTHNFGSSSLNSISTSFWQIRNYGTADLTLTTPVTITGADADQFNILTQPVSPVAASGNTSFSVQFIPTSMGAKTANISIVNNDCGENPYDIILTGTGLAPEINLKQGVTDIPDGGSYDFGVHLGNTDTDVTFTIENTGNQESWVMSPIAIGGANADQFSIQQQPVSPVAASGNTTFVVRFSPTSTGVKTATVAINNSDSDESPYNLTLNGTGLAPEINVKQGTTDIADGGSHDFGGQQTNATTDITFTIQNTGDLDLTVTTPITIGGADADQFSIQQQPTSPVVASGSTTFIVRFTPTSAGAKTATISIANNDSNENPYDLTINGTGILAASPGSGFEYYYDHIDVLGKSHTLVTNYTGEVRNTLELASPDGMLTIFIPEGTVIKNETGQGLHSLEVNENDNPPPPPEGANIIGLPYNFEPDGATFDPPITLTFTYNPGDLPEGVDEEALILAFYDEENGVWIELDCVCDPDTNCITACVSHFTQFAILGKEVILPASFTLSNLTVVPAEVAPGETVTVTVEVANTGGTAGDYGVILQIDGTETETKNVAVNAGNVATVSFTVNREEPGNYTINVSGLEDSYIVIAPAPEPTPIIESEPAPEPEPASPSPEVSTQTPDTPEPEKPPAQLSPPEAESGMNWILIGILAAIGILLVTFLIYRLVNRRD